MKLCCVAYDQATTLTIDVPDKLVPVFIGPARIRGAHGGRGSAKTRTFAKMAAVWGLRAAQAGREGIVLCAREFQNTLDESSLAEVKAAIASEPWLAEHYEVGEKYVRTRCRRVEFSFIGLRHNLESIKSKARILLCWVDEAEPVSEEAWGKLFPTVREHDSEIWVTWNPMRRGSATDKRFRHTTDADTKIVEMNYTDNPWFPAVLEVERQRDLRDRPEQYPHIWGGEYATAMAGAYYAKALAEAKEHGRIARLTPDPLLPLRTFHDIGGSGANADLYVIWVAQFVGREIWVLDHYAAQGQPLAHHVAWMRRRGYERAQVQLPHDGVNENNITAKRYEDHWRDAGFDVPPPFPNQGRGAAMQRIEAGRRLFPRIWFNTAPGVDASGKPVADCTEAGRVALGFYHAKVDDKRGVDLGPDHDWASHDGDAFGLMCVAYEEPRKNLEKLALPNYGVV